MTNMKLVSTTNFSDTQLISTFLLTKTIAYRGDAATWAVISEGTLPSQQGKSDQCPIISQMHTKLII